MVVDLWGLAPPVFAALLAAALALWLLRRALRAVPVSPAGLLAERSGQAVFLFDGQAMLDGTPPARALLAASPVRGGDWARLLAYLAPRFAGVEQKLAGLPQDGQISLVGDDASAALMLNADYGGGLLRIALSQGSDPAGRDRMDGLAQKAASEEVAMLRRITDTVPCPIWQENRSGQVVWANSAYLQAWIAAQENGAIPGWPLPQLFPPDPLGGRASSRKSYVGAGGNALTFDVEVTWAGDLCTCFANSAEATLRAEATLQSFLQTLTKTFAQLPIGLAVFDKDRRLQLFNPALADLTGLAVDFLSRRPTLLAVLDALREKKMLPEPRDYRSWQREVVQMERAAASGLYEETWNLPDGQIFRVTGRPHPNGALALMIEDISTEMSRTRRYRADLELGQSVIDGLDIAVAVFSASAQLVLSNAAFAALLGHDPGETPETCTVQQLSALWRQRTVPGPLWAEFESYVATVGDRTGWSAETRLVDGRPLLCQFTPLALGATLATFRPANAADATPPHLAGEAQLRSA